MHNYVVYCEGLTKKYKSKNSEVLALSRVSFHIKEGEIFGYIGPNGAGKTTTVKILLGLLNYEGVAKLFGTEVVDLGKQKGKIGFMLEERGLYDWFTGYDMLEFYALLYDIPKCIRIKRIKEVLELVGLSDRAKDKINTYSLGMRQRLCFARALLNDPYVLILDEPTLGLDVDYQKLIKSYIKDLAKEKGVTIFITSHNLYDISQLCDKIAIINKGKIVAYGSYEEMQDIFGKKEVLVRIDKRLNEVEREI